MNDPQLLDPRLALPTGAIGSPIDRLEDDRLLRGAGRFVDDLHAPDLLHAVVLRSAVAHGRLRRIEAAAARSMPGVVAVITADEVRSHCARVPVIPMRLDALPQLEPFVQPVIAHDRVRYVGEPLALIVAHSHAQAEDALEAIDVDIDPLPAVVAGGLDVDPNAPALHDQSPDNRAVELQALRGDADAVFASAPYVRRERFRVQRHTAVPMETRGLLAVPDPDHGRLQVYGAAKVPFANRRILAAQLGLEETSIDLLEGDTGGAFGVRGEFYPEDFLVPFAALHCRRPVKWIEDRREHLIASNHARDVEAELELACTREGRILALRGRLSTDAGAYMRTNGIAGSRNVIQLSPGPYRIEHVDMRNTIRFTSKTPVGTYRGPGRFETDFFRERMFDIVAGDLGLDRVEFRRRNLLTRDEMPWTLPMLEPYHAGTVTDSGDYHEAFDLCLREFDWAGRSALAGREVDGRWHGIAVGSYIEGGASGPREGARLVLEDDGRVSVYTGASSVGQGLETVLAQIAADALGLPVSAIRGVFHGSTTGVHEGFGAYSSRSTVMGGSAVLVVARELEQAILAAAASELGCGPGEVSRVAGDRVTDGRGRFMTLAELARARAAHGGISAQGSYAGNKRTYSNGTHAAHVAVDARTGHVELLRYVAVEDVGRIINPRTLHGQTLGAIVQGLGGVFLEHLAYDTEGQLLTGSLADYLPPTADGFPAIEVHALGNHPSPHNPLGAKGAGEGGIIPVGGVIANAVASALSAFGVQPTALPLSPSRLWTLIDQSRRDAATAPAQHPR
jgi:carbon-monoxide dehydrogenase large subunit